MDSKLISVVRDLESEAELVLQNARDQASEIVKHTGIEAARLAEDAKASAQREAERILREGLEQTKRDLEEKRVGQKALLDALLRRASGRLEKAVELILDRLGKA